MNTWACFAMFAVLFCAVMYSLYSRGIAVSKNIRADVNAVPEKYVTLGAGMESGREYLEGIIVEILGIEVFNDVRWGLFELLKNFFKNFEKSCENPAFRCVNHSKRTLMRRSGGLRRAAHKKDESP